jgi:hypothetical protein
VLALNQRIFTSGTCPFPLPAEGHSLPSVSLHAKEPAIRLAVRADRDAVSFAARQWLARNQDDRAVGIQDARALAWAASLGLVYVEALKAQLTRS